jgi:hypothetical protein
MDRDEHLNYGMAFEDDGGKAAEYDDFDEQVEMSPDDAAKHHDYVKRVADKFGFPLPKWTPKIPRHSHR